MQVVGIDAVSLPEVMLQLGVGVLNVTAPLPEPPLVVNVIAVPTNPLFTGLLIMSGACGFKKVNTFAADVVAANSAVAAFVATTEHVVFLPGLTVIKVMSSYWSDKEIEQRAFVAASA